MPLAVCRGTCFSLIELFNPQEWEPLEKIKIILTMGLRNLLTKKLKYWRIDKDIQTLVTADTNIESKTKK